MLFNSINSLSSREKPVVVTNPSDIVSISIEIRPSKKAASKVIQKPPMSKPSVPIASSIQEQPTSAAELTHIEKILGLGDVKARGMVLSAPLPSYPRKSRRKGEEGTVFVKVQVSNGSVKELIVEKSSGYDDLDHAVVNSVSKWRFIQREDIVFTQRFHFRLE
jgi:TonB family protein